MRENYSEDRVNAVALCYMYATASGSVARKTHVRPTGLAVISPRESRSCVNILDVR